MDTSQQVRNNTAAARYELALPGVAEPAWVEYQLDAAGGRDRVIFTHTYVPPEMRGAGAAEKLARAGLADARSQGRRVVAKCLYMAKFIERHAAEYGDLLDQQ